MAKRIIIEVDDQLLRVAEVLTTPRLARIVKLFSVPLAAEGGLLDNLQLIKDLLAKHGLSRGDVDFVVNRRTVEIREITVPPVPNDELPELLKFSAKNEFANVNESWQFDFVPFDDNETVSRSVLATALRPQTSEELKKLSEQLGLKCRRILLRPFCQVAFIVRQLSDSVPTLIVQLTAHTLDLLLVNGNLLRLNRSVLLGGHTDSELEVEARSEIQRTIMMSSKALGGRSVSRILLVGNSPQLTALQAQLNPLVATTAIPVSGSHPSTVEIAASPQELIESYAALIGAAATLVDSTVPAVDFLNPRKRVIRKWDRSRVALWSTVAAASLLIVGILAWYMTSAVKADIKRLEKELATLKNITEPMNNQPSANQRISEVLLVDEWNAERVNWLDEFQEISTRFKTGDDVVLSSISGRLAKEAVAGPVPMRKNVASFSIIGNARSSTVKAELEANLSKRPYDVEPFKLTIDNSDAEYSNRIEGQFSALIDQTAKTREAQIAAEDHRRKMLEAQSSKTPANPPSE